MESQTFAETGRSRTPLAPPTNFDDGFPEAVGLPTSRQPAGAPALNGEAAEKGLPAGSQTISPSGIRLNADENGLPVRVTQLDTNQDGQPDNWRQTTSSTGQLSLAAYDPHQVERLAPALTRLAEGPEVPSGDPTARALQTAARAEGVGAAALIQAAEAINSQYGGLQAQGLPAGEILEAFRAGPLMEQIRAETGLSLSGAALGQLADALLQPQRLLLPADLAAAAASAGGAGEAGMAAQLGLVDGFGAITGVIRELAAATRALGLSQTEAAAAAARVTAGQGESVRADLVAQTGTPAAAHQFVSSVQLLRPLPVPQSVLPVPAVDQGATQTESEE
ncbi:MAG: hypothetical protein KDE28_25180 [Anaerolineales bacterium]|nr:hypothetical protein [Anaerolineales bacterium]